METQIQNQKNYNQITLNSNQLYSAYKDLRPTELAIWLYCVEYQQLNKEGVMRNYGVSEHSYNDAIRGLKEKRYLVGSGKNMQFNVAPKPIEYDLDNIIANISDKQKTELYQKIKPPSKYKIIK